MHAKRRPLACLLNPVAVSALRRSDTEIMGSYPTEGMVVCPCFCCVCVVLCRQIGLGSLHCKVSYEMCTNELQTRLKWESLGPCWPAVS